MKPELIFVNEKDGMVTLPKEDLERLVDRAYEQGKSDGAMTYPWITCTDKTNPIRYDQITCTAKMEGAQDEEV